MKRHSTTAPLLLLLAMTVRAQAQQTTAAITARDVKTRISILADDSTEGRNTGRRGAIRAAEYIARELKRLGAEPAGDNGTYFQRIPWMQRTPDTTAVLRVGNDSLKWGNDYVLMPRLGFALALGGQPFGAEFAGDNVPTIYGGRIGAPTVDPAQARGKVVLFKTGDNTPAWAFWTVDNLRRYSEARAILITSLDGGLPPGLKLRRETYWDSASVPGYHALSVIAVKRNAIAKIFGSDSVSLGAAGVPLSGKARFVDAPTEAPAVNVVGVLRGTDPKLQRTYVAIGSHYDHVGIGPAVDHDSIRVFNSVARPRGADDPQPQSVPPEQWTRINSMLDSIRKIRPAHRDSIFNGADDDASGTTLALEIAEAYVPKTARPRRSLLFVFHTAEEKGLFGAQFYTDHPTVPRDSIIAQVNMDQMGRGQPSDNPTGGPNALVVIGAKRLSTQLGDIAESLNQKIDAPFNLDYSFDRNGDATQAYCRSDHYMYARYGIPVIFFSAAAWHIDYHMVTDETQYIDSERAAKVGNYIAKYVALLANLGSRPVVDQPKPDPNGLCVQ